jgi:hypothetical protein
MLRTWNWSELFDSRCGKLGEMKSTAEAAAVDAQ